MKVFICADIEGTAGITDWDEAEKGKPDYAEFRSLMTAEIVAACDGARAAGASEIVVKDAHWTARNLLVDELGPDVRILRGWSGHPDRMMFGLDETFDAAVHVGHHAKSGSDANPLAHSFTRRVSRITLNGATASEFTFNALTAARYGVPTVFLSGDAEICADARALVPGIATVETIAGFGAATLSLSPAASRAAIRDTVERALKAPVTGTVAALAAAYELVMEFSTPVDAYRGSWYPGVEHPSPRTLVFRTTDYFEVQRALQFIV